MRSFMFLLFAVVLATRAYASDPSGERAKLVQRATAVGMRALNFQQGDLPSLLDAQKDFTPEGWAEFTAKLKGWLDQNGATTFSSAFVPSSPAVDVRRGDGVLYLTMPGVLQHESKNQFGGVSTTRYRAEIDIQLSETSQKVLHLQQRTCGGARAHASCR